MDAAQRASVFEREGKFFEAELIYRQLNNLKPDFPEGKFQYANFKLLHGNYADGWPLFEHRLGTQYYQNQGAAKIQLPLWRGEEAGDKTLLVYFDQGIGDTILCARFIPQARDRVGHLVFMVNPGCAAMFRSLDPRIQIIEDGSAPGPFHLHVSAFGLPGIFQADHTTMPKPPYLFADPATVSKWRDRMDGPPRREGGKAFRIGICWKGSSLHPRDKERSMSLDSLIPVLEQANAEFYSLQVGEGADQAGNLPDGLSLGILEDPQTTDSAHKFVETMGILMNLDLVLSVDTAVANLAAAMDLPVWVMASNVPDWRWLHVDPEADGGYGKAPWYDSFRIFRQSTRYDWSNVIEDVIEALRGEAGIR
jgi:hypothetical protein